MTICFTTRRHYTHSGRFRNACAEFVCLYCCNIVSAGQAQPGGHNRNHCPYCLSSRHLDLYEAGDRLSACRARMKPIGLTLKRTPSKYATETQGELMVIHQCEECGKFSINRIAADDDAEAILTVFESSQWLDPCMHSLLVEGGIFMLGAADAWLLQRRLFGQAAYAKELPSLN
ncbi:MAG TPA: RNHCP domain-containing protein [Anaerolineae bacterium]